jgi:RecA/RadA recombinase
MTDNDGHDPIDRDADIDADVGGVAATDAPDVAGEAAAAETDAAIEAAALAQEAGDDDADGPSSADYSVAFTPRNVAVGLAIVAGVVAFAVSRRRRARRGDD